MNAPSTQVNNVTTPNHAKAVQDELTRLQDTNQLAIHMVENDKHAVKFDKKTWENLGKTAPAQIDSLLRECKPLLQSLSLLPNSQLGLGMRPYNVKPMVLNNYGYLINLSQEQPNPPRVVRVSHVGLDSGNHSDRKNLRLDAFIKAFTLPYSLMSKHLEQFYRHIAGYHEPLLTTLQGISSDAAKEERLLPWRDGIYRAMGGEHAAEYTKKQLAWLGGLYGKNTAYINEMKALAAQAPTTTGYLTSQIDSGVMNYNEALTAMAREHINAIVVPSYNHTNPRLQEYYDARIQLQAALIGLDHRWRGIANLPVVIYHADGPQRGVLQVIGTNAKELQIAAFTALKTIVNNPEYSDCLRITAYPDEPPPRAFNDLAEAVEQHLHIDITTTPRGARGWMMDVNDRLTELVPPQRSPG